jgi:hypothetical protein
MRPRLLSWTELRMNKRRLLTRPATESPMDFGCKPVHGSDDEMERKVLEETQFKFLRSIDTPTIAT